jgi:hypothetical protein
MYFCYEHPHRRWRLCHTGIAMVTSNKGSRRPRATSPLQQALDDVARRNALKAVWSEATG